MQHIHIHPPTHTPPLPHPPTHTFAHHLYHYHSHTHTGHMERLIDVLDGFSIGSVDMSKEKTVYSAPILPAGFVPVHDTNRLTDIQTSLIMHYKVATRQFKRQFINYRR